MTDIVERLRSPANVFYEYAADNGAFLREAADEIERLREALNEIAAWHEGPIGPHMDEPAAASTARLALNKGESHD